MYLFIDNSTDNNIIFRICLNTFWVQREYSGNGRSLIELINILLEEENKRLIDLRGLAVLTGKGRFTSTRIAVTVANALALSLQIPVLAVDGYYEQLLDDLKKAPKGIYVSAQYSAPANIGKKK